MSKIVYHFTSLDVLLKILRNPELGKMTFHATRLDFMNDPTEFRYGLNMLQQKYLPFVENVLEIEDDKYKLSKLWDKDPTKTPEEWIEYVVQQLIDNHRIAYAISLSERDDYLPMWRMYGNDGNGVAIGLDVCNYVEVIRSDNMSIIAEHRPDGISGSFKVCYGDGVGHDVRAIAENVYSLYMNRVKGQTDADEICKMQLDAFCDLFYAAGLIKHKAYQYEKEWRILTGSLNPLMKANSRGDMVAYTIYEIPIGLLKEIVVGPCVTHPDAVVNLLKTRCAQFDGADVRIRKSDCPYRI